VKEQPSPTPQTGATSTKPAVDWPPPAWGWTPSDPDEKPISDRNNQFYYRRIEQDFDGQKVVMILIPQSGPSDPPTFYIMQNKVWNDLYRVFLKSPRSKDLFAKYSGRDGCHDLVKGEWEKGARAPGYPGGPRDLGPGEGRGRIPVFRATATEGQCFAEWMNGRLPQRRQFLRSAGIDKGSVPATFEAHPEGLAINLGATGPWTVDAGDRDVTPDGCRQMVTNGEEFTRTIQDSSGLELPLEQMTGTLRVAKVGTSYLSGRAPTVASLQETDSIPCTRASPEISFRVVLDR
jgi:hypothetical protein